MADDDGAAQPAETERVRNPRTGEQVEIALSARQSWDRVRRALAPRRSRAQIAAAVMLGLLGFMTVLQLQVRSADDTYTGATRTQLIQILDGLNQRNDRLQQEVSDLETEKRQLQSGADSTRAATEQARKRADALGILAGTVAASGPGIQLYLENVAPETSAALLLNAVQELRDAGAEALEINDKVRITASTAFVQAGNAVEVDGVRLTGPFAIDAIGDPTTLETAMRIPGGVEDEVTQQDGIASVSQLDEVEITSVTQDTAPQHASPDSP